MACNCWALPRPARKHSYLVHLVEENTNRAGRTIVQSECPHGMQEFLRAIASTGELVVHDYQGNEFSMDHPIVINIDDRSAAHLPIVDPSTC